MFATPAFFLAVGVAVLVGALVFGRFSIGFDDSTSSDSGWPITRRDNPRAFWIGILAIVAWVVAFGLIVAANSGFHLEPPNFKL